MKKDTIYTGAIFYQKTIVPEKLKPSDARYFRDAFKDIVEKAQQIETDRQELIKEFNKENTDIEKEPSAELLKEVSALFEEEIEVTKLPADFDERLEGADIKISSTDIDLLDKLK